MKKFWKILGLGALAAGLTPYKVEKNEETGESSYQALLWRITSAPGEDGDKRSIDINLGEGTLTSRLAEKLAKKEEAHLFSDELSVEYSAPAAEEPVEETAEAIAEDAAEAAEAETPAAPEISTGPVPPEIPAEPEEPAEPEAPAEPEEAEAPKAE